MALSESKINFYKKHSSNFILLLVLIDSFLLNIAEVASFEIRFEGGLPEYNFVAYQNMILFITAVRLASFYVFKVYEHIKAKSIFQTFIEIVKANTLSTLMIIVAVFFFRNFAYPRTVITMSWFFTTLAIFSFRVFVKNVVSLLFNKEYLYTNIIIVGINREAQRLALRLLQDSSEQFRIVGFVRLKDEDKPDEIILDDIKIIGNIVDMKNIVRNNTVDEIIVADRDISDKQLTYLLSSMHRYDISVRVIPSLYETIIGATVSSNMPFTLVKLTVEPIRGWYPGFKRLVDVVLAIFGLIFLSPVLFIAMIAIRWENPEGKVFFSQNRIGLGGKEFTLYKLKTMIDGAEDKTGPVWAEKNDPRVTAVGKFLRITRIDEIPQLINILKGEMSLVGPRPERPFFVKELLDKIPCYGERFNVKPGITGWAQVNFKYASSVADTQEKLMYDLYYIQNMSPSLDFFILLKTVGLIFGKIEVH